MCGEKLPRADWVCTGSSEKAEVLLQHPCAELISRRRDVLAR